MEDQKLHLALHSRRLWRGRGLLVVAGDAAPLAAGKRAYDARYGIPAAAGPGGDALQRLLAAAALAAVSLAERESWGWTMTAAGVGAGLFCGVEPEGMICGAARAAERDRAVAYLQRKKGGGPLVESRFAPVSADPAASVERYFLEVEQIATRIALAGDRGALVQALPGGALGELRELDGAALVARVDEAAAAGELDQLDDVVVFYECRCDGELIADMIAGLPEAARRELWGDEDAIRAACPRCGREFALARDVAFPATGGPTVR